MNWVKQIHETTEWVNRSKNHRLLKLKTNGEKFLRISSTLKFRRRAPVGTLIISHLLFRFETHVL